MARFIHPPSWGTNSKSRHTNQITVNCKDYSDYKDYSDLKGVFERGESFLKGMGALDM